MTETIHDLAYIIWWHHALNSISHNLAQAAALSFAFELGDEHAGDVYRRGRATWEPGCGKDAK